MVGNRDGIMVILSSPSGAGKTTLVKLLSQKKKNYKISVSHTTRKPRANEINGQDYYFIEEPEFKKLVNKNEFLEHARVFKNYYGTSKTDVLKSLSKGENVIFDIDWQGTKQIKEKKLHYKLITFFVLPPSKKVLLNRLSNRDMKDKLIVEERMKEFNKDILHWKDYDYVVINDDLDRCFIEINDIIDSEMEEKKISYNKNLIEKYIEELTN